MSTGDRSRPRLKTRYPVPGTQPEQLGGPPPDNTSPPVISRIRYSPSAYEEKTLPQLEPEDRGTDPGVITWINIEGGNGPRLLEQLSRHYGFHCLPLEDVVNTGQRPKVENYADFIFVVAYGLLNPDDLEVHQINMFVKNDLVITVEEAGSILFEPVRERLRNGGSTIRQRGTDFLVYSLCDTLVDQFFPIIEDIAGKLEAIEDQLIQKPDRSFSWIIHQFNRDFIMLSHIAWGMQDMLKNLYQEEPLTVDSETRLYLRDVSDHLFQIINMIETYRGIATSLLDVYLSSVSNQLNSIMKTLTIVATIFIPLTFIVGIYGMNFQNMPELHWIYGYPAVWAVMLLIAGSMIWFMVRKRWL